MTTNELSRWPIRQVGRLFILEDGRTGERLSWHRTRHGALRARLQLINLRDELLPLFIT